MRGFLRCVTSGAITVVLPVLAQAQSPSCYITTTVVFGNPQSILSSLSMVANITNIPSSTTTSTLASSWTLIPSLTFPTAYSAIPAATGFFRITVNVPGPGTLRARGIEYVSFSGNDGILVTDPIQATLFQFINGCLQTSTGLYVGASTDSEYAQFEALSIPPPVAQGWTPNSNGNISFTGASDFCYTPDDVLYFVFSEQPAFACTIVNLAAAEAAALTSLLIASQSAAAVTMIGITIPSSSALVVPTSSRLGTFVAFGGSSQEASLTSLHSLSMYTPALSPSTSTSSSIAMAPSSTVTRVGSTTSSSAILSSVSPTVSSIGTGSSLPITSASSSLTLAVVSNPTNILGPGQLSTQVSSLFSLPIVVYSTSSSLSSSTSTTTSPLLSSSSISSTASSSRANSSGVLSSFPLWSSATSSAAGISSPISSAYSGTSAAARSSTTSLILTTTIASLSSPTTSSISSASSLSALPSPYQRNTGKRGLAYTNVTLTQLYSLQGQNSRVSWAYDYYSLPNASNNVGPVNPALTFIPLLYNNAPSLTSIWAQNAQYSIQNYGSDALFSFNEPDACNNGQSACMSVSASVSAYQSYMQPFAGQVLLGAPSVTNGSPPASLTYLSYFIGNCTGCTIDFINLHWYSSPYSFSYLTSYIQQAYAVGGNRPIYLTEFGMDNIYYSEADVATFLKNATTWLDAQSYVHRYSWFGDFAQSGPSYEQGYGYLVNASGDALSSEGIVWNNYTGGYVPCPISSGC